MWFLSLVRLAQKHRLRFWHSVWLNKATESGIHAFHDLQTDKVGNIDPVAVGTCGVFLIETKTRHKHGGIPLGADKQADEFTAKLEERLKAIETKVVK